MNWLACIQNKSALCELIQPFFVMCKKPNLAWLILTIVIEVKLKYDDSGLDPYHQEPLTFNPLALSL